MHFIWCIFTHPEERGTNKSRARGARDESRRYLDDSPSNAVPVWMARSDTKYGATLPALLADLPVHHSRRGRSALRLWVLVRESEFWGVSFVLCYRLKVASTVNTKGLEELGDLRLASHWFLIRSKVVAAPSWLRT